MHTVGKSNMTKSTPGNILHGSINQSINQSVRPIVAELLLGKVRNEKKKTKTKRRL